MDDLNSGYLQNYDLYMYFIVDMAQWVRDVCSCTYVFAVLCAQDSSRPVGSDLDSGSEKEGNPVTNKRAIGKSSGARKTPATVVSLSHDSCSSESESDVMQQKRKKKKKL